MELKLKYEYTYFIKPFLIKENRYEKYLLSILRNKKYNLKIFEKERDLNLYSYFLPEAREYFFPSFSFSKEKLAQLDKLEAKFKANILSKLPCNIFEYSLNKQIQGKINESEGIFFNIDKIEIICFDTGICFLVIKTDLENSDKFSDLLDFNYKFKDINSDLAKLKEFTNIKIQTDRFSNMSELSDFINNIIGINNKYSELQKEDLLGSDFFVYTYSCIDQEDWSVEDDFESLKNVFLKYSKVLTSNNEIDLNENEFNKSTQNIEEYKYSKFGFTKYSASLMTSNIDINNYTKLLFEFENEYLYTLIISLYQRIYLKRIEKSFNEKSDINSIRRKISYLTKKIWSNDITNSTLGTIFYNKWKEIFELNQIYDEIKNKYDIIYKNFEIEKNSKINKIISVALGISILLNIVNLIALLRL